MKEDELNRIVILDNSGKYKIFGDLKKCRACNINFTAIQPCIICAAIKEKEAKLGRRLNKEELIEINNTF